MDLGNLLSTGLAIVSIATLAGLGLLRGTVTNLREQLRDERDSNSSLRTSRDEDRKLLEQQKKDLDALARVVTGEVHWTALGHKLDEHHDEARAYWTRAEQQTDEILTELRRIRREEDPR